MGNPYLSIAPKPVKGSDARRRKAAKSARTKEIHVQMEPDFGPHVCFLCGRNGCTDPLDKHHVWGGALRSKSEQYGAYVYLCHSRCHENGPEAAHKNTETADKLHRWAQEKIMREQGWTTEQFIQEFGRNYL